MDIILSTNWLATDITAEEFKNMIDYRAKCINETCDKAILEWEEAQEHNKNTHDPHFRYKWAESPESINKKRQEALELIKTWRAELEILREHEDADRRAKNWTPLNASPREYHISLELMKQARTFFKPCELTDLKICFNHESGNVYILNEYDYRVYMLNGKFLEEWYFLPYSGIEGFKDDLNALDYSKLEKEDQEFLDELFE